MGNTNGLISVNQANPQAMRISDPMGRQVNDTPPPSSPSWSTAEHVFGSFLSRDTGTLKKLGKKLKTKLRKSCNHSQVFREFANLLSIRELAHIYDEYKSTYFLKELFQHAENARPTVSSVRNDLLKLYESNTNHDIKLVYKTIEFPIHKSIICVRSPYFRELLSKKPNGSVVQIETDIDELNIELFNDLLKFLYTGELTISYDSRSNSSSYKTLIRISQKFGVPNALQNDLKYLFDTGIYSDASLCFQFSSDLYSDSSQRRCLCFPQAKFACHQAILISRSKFFCNIIQRQQTRNNNKTNDHQGMKIILDENIIPRRYGKIILHIMYRDSEELLPLVQSLLCKCSANMKESSQNVSIVNELIELYEIGRFLELESLIYATEDLIVEHLSTETIIPILKWTCNSYGSLWIERQAMSFLRDEFLAISSNQSLLSQIEEKHMIELLKSDFIEASELDLLKAVIKWGESKVQNVPPSFFHEPNLIMNTLSRRSTRKKDVDDKKLLDIISPMISFIRIGHILPIESEFLNNCLKRGIIDGLPVFMQDNSSSSSNYSAWFRNRSKEFFIRPRLFMAYFDECKTILEQRLGYRISYQDDEDDVDDVDDDDSLPIDGGIVEAYNEDNNLSIDNDSLDRSQLENSNILNIPDALYMINNLNISNNPHSDNDLLSPKSPDKSQHFTFESSSTASSTNGYSGQFDSNSKINHEQINMPVIDEQTMMAMKLREKELRSSPFCVRVLKVQHNRSQALHFIRLRVVREFGLSDIVCDLISNRPEMNKGFSDNSSLHESCHSQSLPSPSFSLPSPSFPVILPSSCIPLTMPSPVPLSPSNNQSSKFVLPPVPPPRPSKRKIRSKQMNLSLPNNNCDPFSLQSELQLESNFNTTVNSQFSSNS